jgi:hypothetical protein
MALTPTLQRLEWEPFLAGLEWPQGEHVVVIGTTGSGKSTLIRALAERRDWVVGLASKKADRTYDRYLELGYERIKRWPPPIRKDQVGQHVLLWPRVKKMDDLAKMTPIFRKCLQDVFVDENWTVLLDDMFYLAKVLGLTAEIEALNYQVRSLGVTLIGGMQRPSWVPRSTWDQASHAFLRRLADIEDLRTLRGLSHLSANQLEELLRTLRRHEWLYLPVAHADERPPVIVRPPA